MRGTVRVSKRPAKMRARLSVSGLASDATADVTDLMLQGGGTETGWVPHLHEMMTAPGGDVSPELEARVVDLEDTVTDNQLNTITWWNSPSGSRTFPVPDFDSSQRSVSALRLMVDVVTDGLGGVSGLTVTCGSATTTVDLRSSGDSHRYALALDFPSGDPSSMDVEVSGSASAGRLGVTSPRLVTPVERSA